MSRSECHVLLDILPAYQKCVLLAVCWSWRRCGWWWWGVVRVVYERLERCRCCASLLLACTCVYVRACVRVLVRQVRGGEPTHAHLQVFRVPLHQDVRARRGGPRWRVAATPCPVLTSHPTRRVRSVQVPAHHLLCCDGEHFAHDWWVLPTHAPPRGARTSPCAVARMCLTAVRWWPRCAAATVHERYDLKGSWVNRHRRALGRGEKVHCRHCNDLCVASAAWRCRPSRCHALTATTARVASPCDILVLQVQGGG